MYVSLNAAQRALRLVDGLAELDNPAGFAELALPGLAQLVGCDTLTYNEIGPAPVHVSAAGYPPGAVPPASLAVFAAHVHEHPLVNHYRDTGDGKPVKISDFLSRRRFHRLGLYAELFRHIPVEYQIAFSMQGPDAQVIGIALNRASSDFTEADRDLLGLLRDPLMTALLRARGRQCARHALAEASSRRLADLTDREVQVLQLVALGRTNVAIARALDVSPRTIAKHLERIYRKLNVTSRAAAVYYATTGSGR